MTNELTVLIVDDEKDARDLLKYMLNAFEIIKKVDEASNTESALLKFLEHNPDIVFVDLIMPGKNGIEFIEILKKQKTETCFVIVSAHSGMAIEAIKNEVYDFILKPVTPEKLKNVINKIQKKKADKRPLQLENILENIKHGPKLKLASTNSHVLIDPDEIIFCKAEGGYTHFHLDNGKTELANTNLGKVEEVLADFNFFRIGRSTLINLDKLWRANKKDNSCILLSNKKEIKLYGSKPQIKELCKMETKQ